MADSAGINVEVWDATGNKKVIVNLPRSAPVNRIIVLLVDRMNLPRNSPDGQLMSYKFHHKASSRQLLDEETLEQAGVKEGDVLRLQPEITAGRSPLFGPEAQSSRRDAKTADERFQSIVLCVLRGSA